MGSFAVVCYCWRELLAVAVRKGRVGSGDCRKKKKLNGVLVVDSPEFDGTSVSRKIMNTKEICKD
uniref:Uncharacterized protein n=1 Tax=Solanum tuberosum TaxID=4113 RepID=M0ZKF7_SOLTU